MEYNENELGCNLKLALMGRIYNDTASKYNECKYDINEVLSI